MSTHLLGGNDVESDEPTPEQAPDLSPTPGWWSTPGSPAGEPADEPVTTVLDVPAPEDPVRRRGPLRKVLLALVVLLTIGGLVGGSLAYVDHRRDVQRREKAAARLAAQKKAEAAYRAAMRPLVLRVYDAVQPVQDVYDAFAAPVPGLLAARDDIIRHGGMVGQLKAVTAAAVKLPIPPTYTQIADDVKRALRKLTLAADALVVSTGEKGDSSGDVPSFGTGFEVMLDAEISWSAAVDALDTASTWPLPDANRVRSRGRHAPTVGGFIMGSDVACGKGNAALEFEDFKHPERAIRSTFPKISRELRATVTSLRKVPYPARQRSVRHRLEVGWGATVEAAKQIDAQTAAYRRHDRTAYLRAFRRMKTAFVGMNDLSRAYRSLGVSECVGMFDASDDDGGSSTTTA